MEGDGIVTQWVENEKYAFKMEGGRASAVGTFTLELAYEGCRVSFQEDLAQKGLMGRIIGALFLKRVKTRNMEEGVERLKTAVEGS